MTHSLTELLDNLSKTTLQQIARMHNLPVPVKKNLLVESLHSHLSNPQIVANTLARLPQTTQKIFDRLQLKGGRATTMGLLNELEQSGILRPQPRGWQPIKPAANGQAVQEKPQESFDQLVWPLLQHGLVFYRSFLVTTPDALTRYDVPLFIPRDILQAVNGANQPLQTISADKVERTEEGSAQNFQRDLYLYWNYVREHEVLLNATGLLPKRHLTKLNETLIHKGDVKSARDESDLPRLAFIRALMEEAGLLKANGLRLEANPSAHDFFSYSLTRRTDRLYEAYKKSSLWNELLRLSVTPQTNAIRSPRNVSLIARARQWLLTLLGERITLDWLSLSDLINKVRANNYEFLFSRERKDFGFINPYYYYHNPLGWGFPVNNEEEGWDKVEGGFVRNIIIEPLYWLGLVSLGYEQNKVVAFKLTTIGSYLFGISQQAPTDDAANFGRRLVVQPNFQIFALEPVAEQMLAALDRFADRVKADRVFEYQLTRDSIYRATQNSMSVQEIIAFLTQATSTPLPQNVERTLEEWGEMFGRIIIRRKVSLLHTRDAQLLDELAATPETGALFHSRPMPYVAIAHSTPNAREQLTQALLERGQLPAITHGVGQNGYTFHHEVQVDERGKVSLAHALPNIFLLQALERHVERRPDGLYLSEAAVKADRAAGDSITQIIARWEQWHRGPLPHALLDNIRRWGQFYGSAHIQKLTLIKMPSEELLHQLMSEPSLAPYLSPYNGDPATAIVSEDHLADLQQWLMAHGVPIEEPENL